MARKDSDMKLEAGHAPRILSRPTSITAEVEIPPGGAEGVLVAQGGAAGGYSLYVKDKKLHYAYNDVADERFHFESTTELPVGKLSLRLEFEPTGAGDIARGRGAPGRAQLYVNERLVGAMQLPFTIPLSLHYVGGVSVGRDEGAPVTSDYKSPFSFTGKLESVTFDVSGNPLVDQEPEMNMAMAHQ